MQLVINTRGSFLKKSNNCFLVKNDEKTFEVSSKRTRIEPGEKMILELSDLLRENHPGEQGLKL